MLHRTPTSQLLGLLALSVMSLGGAACTPSIEASSNRPAPESLGDGWSVAAPERMGVDPTMLRRLSERLGETRKHGIDSIVIARRGRLVYEAYTRKGGRDEPHDLRSATKSITALLVGIAMDRGLLRIRDRVHKHQTGSLVLTHAPGVTIEHLLTMRSGLDCDDRDRSSRGHEERMYRRHDWVAFFSSLPAVATPGERSAYCTGGVVALGELLRAATGQGADAFARGALFDPLNIGLADWARFKGGEGVDTGGHLKLRTRDFAKIGELMRGGGQWHGEQLVSSAWIANATTTQTQVDGEDYGYLWWLADLPTSSGPTRVWYASGNGGQLLFVVPSLELVVAFTGRNYNSPRARVPFEILARVIVPGLT